MVAACRGRRAAMSATTTERNVTWGRGLRPRATRRLSTCTMRAVFALVSRSTQAELDRLIKARPHAVGAEDIRPPTCRCARGPRGLRADKNGSAPARLRPTTGGSCRAEVASATARGDDPKRRAGSHTRRPGVADAGDEREHRASPHRRRLMRLLGRVAALVDAERLHIAHETPPWRDVKVDAERQLDAT